MKNKRFFLFAFFAIVPFLAFSQDDIPVKERSFRERIFFGGNFGLQFGTITFVDVSPMIGYRFTEKFSAGPGISYMFYRERFSGFTPFETSIYGGRIFTRYEIYRGIFFHGEYEVLNREVFDSWLFPERFRTNVTSILLGGGIRQHMGGRTFLNLLVLWNINESAYSMYNNPIIRMGFNVGF
jgi:hypothetical protein